MPGVTIGAFGGALLVAALVALLNAILPPLIAALRLPLTLALGFVLVALVDALLLELASRALPAYLGVHSLGDALLAALVMAIVSLVLQVMLGANDEDTYSLRVIRRVARRQGTRIELTRRDPLPGDRWAGAPVLRARCETESPALARWVAGYASADQWEPDLSSQTGASQAGILLGSNDDIPAFRWVEKRTGR